MFGSEAYKNSVLTGDNKSWICTLISVKKKYLTLILLLYIISFVFNGKEGTYEENRRARLVV